MRTSARSIPITFILLSLLGAIAFAAPGGNKGKPGGNDGSSSCDPGDLFPALIYPVSSDSNDGTRNLKVTDSNGCLDIQVEQNIQLGRVRLKYDVGTGFGYYAWSENTFPGYPPGLISLQHFTVAANILTKIGDPVDLYQGTDYLTSFDLQGDLLTLVDEKALLVIDLSVCDGSPCTIDDAVSVSSGAACPGPSAGVGCVITEYGSVAMTLDGSAIYFDVQMQDSGNRIDGTARVSKGLGWALQIPELYLRDDNYNELQLYGLSATGQYIAFGYLAGFQDSLRDDRVVIIDNAITGQTCPCEASLAQDFSAWTANWTIDDKLYVLGTKGKGRKLRHPIEEFDPETGVRRTLGITLEDHPTIDSSL